MERTINDYDSATKSYNERKESLINLFKIPGIDDLFKFIEEKGFTRLPASLSHHLNETGGLLIHSMNVTDSLIELTQAMGLEWERIVSPLIVGMFHDLCKLEFYVAEPCGNRFRHNDYPDYNLGGHGMLSVVLAQKFIKLTDEEIHCIRFHMGAYEQKDWSAFDLAIKKYPNVLYTHTADMIASKIIER